MILPQRGAPEPDLNSCAWQAGRRRMNSGIDLLQATLQVTVG
jgi:hypothetical protein